MRRLVFCTVFFFVGCAGFQDVLDEVTRLGQDVAAIAPGVVSEVKPAIQMIAENPNDPTAIIVGVGTAVAAVAGGVGELLRRKLNKQAGNG